MAIDNEKVQTRLEARHSELRHEIAAILAEEHSLEQQGLGVEDLGETAQDLQEYGQDEPILQNQRHLLAAIDQALNRLHDGTYGLCIDCGQPIPEKRLEAIPWAVRDRACQERYEK
jgi:DnaK suppressor protein